jgi:hypothetical protein
MKNAALFTFVLGFCFVFAGCSADTESARGSGADGGGDTDTNTDTDPDAGDSDGGDIPDMGCDPETDFWCNGCNNEAGTWARLTGVVLGPGGLFPVARALVAAYPDAESIPEIPDGAYCEECIDITGISAAQTSPDGAFCLRLTPGRTYELVVQKGQFRRIRTYTVKAGVGETVDLDQELITLPSVRDDDLGDMIPHIAVILGDSDPIEDVLAKAGLGEESTGNQWVRGSEEGIWDAYDNRDNVEYPNYGANPGPMLRDLNAMLDYHIIFVPCAYNASRLNTTLIHDPVVQQNIRDYVWQGGKIYVSDYSYYAVDSPWDEFLFFVDTHAASGGCAEAGTPDGCNHGPPFQSPGKVKDGLLKEWLTILMEDKGKTIDDLTLYENWNTIGEMGPGIIGRDPDSGDDIMGSPSVWVEGPWTYDDDDIDSIEYSEWDATTQHPLTVSWPYNCGRAIYTTYHTVGATGGAGLHEGLIEQEMILYFLLMELGVCQNAVPVV